MPFLASHPWHPRRSRKGPGWKLLVEPKMSPRIVRKPIFSSLGRPLFHRTQGHFWDANAYPFLAPKRVPEIVPLWKQVRATSLGPNFAYPFLAPKSVPFLAPNPFHFWRAGDEKNGPQGNKKTKKHEAGRLLFQLDFAPEFIGIQPRECCVNQC